MNMNVNKKYVCVCVRFRVEWWSMPMRTEQIEDENKKKHNWANYKCWLASKIEFNAINTHKFKLVAYQFMMYMKLFNKLQTLRRAHTHKTQIDSMLINERIKWF